MGGGICEGKPLIRGVAFEILEVRFPPARAAGIFRRTCSRVLPPFLLNLPDGMATSVLGL